MIASRESAVKFDPDRAAAYERQSRIALAGYDACHELTACLLAASLGAGSTATILVAGAGGTASEIITAGSMEPHWRFVAVDPSAPMLEVALARVAAAGMAARTLAVLGTADDLPEGETFDAATLIGVLHHVTGEAAKCEVLRQIRRRLRPGGPFVLACNHHAYASQPLLLKAWGERWRQQGSAPDDVAAKLATILHGADPPTSESAVAALLEDAGFEAPLRFFTSLFWGAWITRKV